MRRGEWLLQEKITLFRRTMVTAKKTKGKCELHEIYYKILLNVQPPVCCSISLHNSKSQNRMRCIIHLLFFQPSRWHLKYFIWHWSKWKMQLPPWASWCTTENDQMFWWGIRTPNSISIKTWPSVTEIRCKEKKTTKKKKLQKKKNTDQVYVAIGSFFLLLF